MEQILIVLIILSAMALILTAILVRNSREENKEEDKSSAKLDQVKRKSQPITGREAGDIKEDILSYTKDILNQAYGKLDVKNIDMDIRISDELRVDFEKDVWREGLENIVNVFNDQEKKANLIVEWESDMRQLNIKNDSVALSERDLRDILHPFEKANEEEEKRELDKSSTSDRNTYEELNMDDYSWQLFVRVKENSTEIIFKKV